MPDTISIGRRKQLIEYINTSTRELGHYTKANQKHNPTKEELQAAVTPEEWVVLTKFQSIQAIRIHIPAALTEEKYYTLTNDWERQALVVETVSAIETLIGQIQNILMDYRQIARKSGLIDRRY